MHFLIAAMSVGGVPEIELMGRMFETPELCLSKAVFLLKRP
jgi:hypothetical protein